MAGATLISGPVNARREGFQPGASLSCGGTCPRGLRAGSGGRWRRGGIAVTQVSPAPPLAPPSGLRPTLGL